MTAHLLLLTIETPLGCRSSAADVEDITSKTGSFKKFSIFVRMLQSAVLQQSDSVFIDLLTCQDLELLKAKKAAAAQADAAAQQQQQQPRQLPSGLANKRYLILTYASEFDRVHYPLPLMADEQPDPARFKAVIASLRQQLAEVQAGLPPPQLLQPQGGQQLLLGGPRARSRAGAQVCCGRE
jgi:coiled-coil domain-containing protein 61